MYEAYNDPNYSGSGSDVDFNMNGAVPRQRTTPSVGAQSSLDAHLGYQSSSPPTIPVGEPDDSTGVSALDGMPGNYPGPGPEYDEAAASYYSPAGPQGSSPSSGGASSGTSAPQGDTFTFSSDAFENVGGVRMINMMGFEPAPGKTYKDYTLLTEKKADGTVSYKTMLIPEGEAGKGMSRILTFDETTGKATYGKPTAEEPTALQSLYKSPQFMAPVVSSVLNGLAQSFIAERLAKAQRNEQRRMLDAQFQLANAKEEADMAERRRVSKRYWELKKKQGRA
jgi:hypothetical protein